MLLCLITLISKFIFQTPQIQYSDAASRKQEENKLEGTWAVLLDYAVQLLRQLSHSSQSCILNTFNPFLFPRTWSDFKKS